MADDPYARIAELEAEVRQARADLQRSNVERGTALEQQTATAEILRTIATGPAETQRVLDDIVAAAGRLLASDFVLIHQPDGDRLRTVARHGALAEQFS